MKNMVVKMNEFNLALDEEIAKMEGMDPHQLAIFLCGYLSHMLKKMDYHIDAHTLEGIKGRLEADV